MQSGYALEEKKSSVKAKVVWGSVVRSGKDEKGEDILLYRSGLEFHEPGKVDFITGILSSFPLGWASLRGMRVPLGSSEADSHIFPI